MNISYRRIASAPYSVTMSSGLTTLPRLLDIFSPSEPRIIPWLGLGLGLGLGLELGLGLGTSSRWG
jgi:hypothetical protein